MRGSLSQPRSRAISAKYHFNSRYLFSLCAIIFSAIFSGCASVSAENSAAELAAAKVSVIPSAVEFKNVVVGQKNSQTVKITNFGKEPFDLQRLQVSGTDFALSSTKTPVILAPGKHLNLSVAFAPASTASESGSLLISSSDFKSPVKVPLSGSGEKAAPGLAISPGSLNFGTHAVKSSTSESVTLTNTGNIALKINSISVPNSAFSVSGLAKGVSLSADQKLEFKVWFHPVASGNSAATISLGTTASLAPAKLAVSGAATNSTLGPTANSNHSVTLDWHAGSKADVGYHVYRSDVSGGPFARINRGTILALSYVDKDVLAGAHYFYVVTAVGEGGGSESPNSNEVMVVIPSD
jgi:hypothetical protein